MENFSDIQEKVFSDCKKIITELSLLETKEELISAQEKIFDLENLMSFLAVSKNYEKQSADISEFSKDNESEKRATYEAEEEVIFNNQLNEIDETEIHHPENLVDILEEEAAFNNELNEIDANETQEEQPLKTAELEDEEMVAIEEILEADKLNEETESINEVFEEKEIVSQYDENRGKIVEISKREESIKDTENPTENLPTEIKLSESKFKLASIKGLRKVESLFDNDPLEEINEEEKSEKTGSLFKNNIPTDYMEAEKSKLEFKLDLNDKIAFSKMLFGGSQSELNETVNILNTFKNMEEAKEYLSDLYYQKNWKNAEEYAQRLWTLVENKFL